ncbi:MAG: hypothetical protein AB4426_01420 [Xenococcaceae cyanobacterium]
MLRTLKYRNLMVVDLTENVLVRTFICKENHAALRSGFAGFPANPRWNVNKFRAWKTGRQWREALTKGKMVVRSTDSMLVSATEQEDNVEEDLPSLEWFHCLVWSKQLLASSQIV